MVEAFIIRELFYAYWFPWTNTSKARTNKKLNPQKAKGLGLEPETHWWELILNPSS